MVRRLHAVSDPLGSYLRVGSRDHTFLSQMLVDGRPLGTGLIADPANLSTQRDLWEAVVERQIESVLDPRSLELSTPGGFQRGGVAAIPWAGDRPHEPGDLRGDGGRRLCEAITEFTSSHGHTAVLRTNTLDSVADGSLVGRR